MRIHSILDVAFTNNSSADVNDVSDPLNPLLEVSNKNICMIYEYNVYIIYTYGPLKNIYICIISTYIYMYV